MDREKPKKELREETAIMAVITIKIIITARKEDSIRDGLARMNPLRGVNFHAKMLLTPSLIFLRVSKFPQILTF